MTELAALDSTALQAMLRGSVVAPWVLDLGLKVITYKDGELTLSLPVQAHLVHGGGVLCGQAMMAAADTAMVLAISGQLGAFRPMTTVQLQTSFLRPVSGGETAATVTARVLRLGKNLAFGEIEIKDGSGRLAAHSTTTYALL